MSVLDNFFYIGLPYIALVVFFVGTIYRYKVTKFNYSSLSSQFLESSSLFWGAVPFHWGILFLFFGHLAAFLIPDSVLAFNSHPLRLLILEITAFTFGIIVLFGLMMLFIRRLKDPRLKEVTSAMDITIELLLLAQVILGLLVALTARWGSSWFAAVLTPYLYSIFLLQPDISAVAALPLLVKLHIIGAYLIVLFIPFSRLVHVLVVPLHYIWRPYQRVMWYWHRKQVRNPNSPWTMKRPENN
ncbi:MAG: respiratory nitrate reductase subunit gamma [Calditrichaeota bacterium]|nr:MAG: respiratory nitrate reductase subunit gamma [Calditrichota bacterium]MBL1205145.1 respiratory nitrate reductase subunit gamma [Calditrichota bacterium]NOG44975.1 respiratory nitrate reductase subunit gamma [Calditrichota bacterium]